MFSGLSSFNDLKEVLIKNNVKESDIQIFNTSQDYDNLPLSKYNMMNVLNVNNTKLSTGHAVLLVKFNETMYYYFDPTSVISNEIFSKVFRNKRVQILCNLDQLQDFRKNQSCGWYVVREIFLIELGKLRVKNYIILEYDNGKITCLKRNIKNDFDTQYNNDASKIEESQIKNFY